MGLDALVLIVDDDASVRRALARVLRSAGHVVEVFRGVRELLAHLPPPEVPCCVVSALRAPGVDGLALQEELRASAASVSIVFLTVFTDVRAVVRAMKGGAVDLLPRPVPSDVLVATVATALERSRRAVASLQALDELRARYRTLTRREREVFTLVTAGLLNKQVGFALGTSEKTVKVQRARVVQKMGARSLPDLVRMADLLELSAPREAAEAPPAPTLRVLPESPGTAAGAIAGALLLEPPPRLDGQRARAS